MNNNSVVAVYSTHTAAEVAVKDLQKSGFDMKQLSIVGRDYETEQHVVGYYNMGDRMKVWAKTGAFWGGMRGLLFGSGLFFIPGIGPLLFAGPFISSIIGGLEGAVLVGGMSAIGAGLTGMSIPPDSIVRYETALKAGKFVLIANGTVEDNSRAKIILGHGKPDSLDQHPQA